LIHEKKTPNAAHHAPAGPIAFDDILRVAGRVHALVRPLDQRRQPATRDLRPSSQSSASPRNRREGQPQSDARRRRD
jgi:hypothetical protein